MSDSLTYDLVVLGGGTGGYAAALRAAELDMKVALIERDKVGGTCLHRGCVPTKALLHAAEVADTAKESSNFGIDVEFKGIDIEKVLDYKDNVISRNYKGLQGLVKARGIDTYFGTGKLTGKDTVEVDGEDGTHTVTGTNVLLSTGSTSKTIGLDITERVITSTEALQLNKVPESAIVLGGGVIGVEFASVWRSFGVEVTVVEALEHLVPNEDIALSKALERAFRKRGITAKLGVRFSGVTQTDAGVTVTLEDGTAIDADYLLVAVGRGPASAGLGFEEAGVTIDRGFVTVDERLQTNVPHVWAVGDIVPGLQLAHRGFQQGIFAAEQIAGLSPVPVPESTIPRVTYSSPEVASVGLTEAQARALHGDAVVAYEYNLAGNGKSEILGTAGIVKVVRQVEGPVLGVHMVGDRVGELITEGQLAVGWEAHPEDLAPLIHAHPTQSEALGEAFLALAGKPLHAL